MTTPEEPEGLKEDPAITLLTVAIRRTEVALVRDKERRAQIVAELGPIDERIADARSTLESYQIALRELSG